MSTLRSLINLSFILVLTAGVIGCHYHDCDDDWEHWGDDDCDCYDPWYDDRSTGYLETEVGTDTTMDTSPGQGTTSVGTDTDYDQGAGAKPATDTQSNMSDAGVSSDSAFCMDNDDCGMDKSCVLGKCNYHCQETAECPTGQICLNGVCEDNPAPGGQCLYNDDCGDGMYCINATCFNGCETDGECLATEACLSGICRPNPAPGAECYVNSDCVDLNRVCFNGECVAE